MSINAFSDWFQDEFPNLNIAKTVENVFYISKTGEYLGTNEEEAKAKTKGIVEEQENEITYTQEQSQENTLKEEITEGIVQNNVVDEESLEREDEETIENREEE